MGSCFMRRGLDFVLQCAAGRRRGQGVLVVSVSTAMTDSEFWGGTRCVYFHSLLSPPHPLLRKHLTFSSSFFCSIFTSSGSSIAPLPLLPYVPSSETNPPPPSVSLSSPPLPPLSVSLPLLSHPFQTPPPPPPPPKLPSPPTLMPRSPSSLTRLTLLISYPFIVFFLSSQAWRAHEKLHALTLALENVPRNATMASMRFHFLFVPPSLTPSCCIIPPPPPPPPFFPPFRSLSVTQSIHHTPHMIPIAYLLIGVSSSSQAWRAHEKVHALTLALESVPGATPLWRLCEGPYWRECAESTG